MVAAAWLAGIIDGEGYVSLGAKRFCPEITVTNTDEKIIDRIMCIAGGRKYTERRNNRPKNKKLFIWRVTNLHALEVAEFIVDYSVSRNERLRQIISAYNERSLLRLPNERMDETLSPCIGITETLVSILDFAALADTQKFFMLRLTASQLNPR